MNRFLYKLGTQSIVTAVMLFLVLSPFQALLAQAQTEPAPGSPVFQAAQAQVPAAQAAAAAAINAPKDDLGCSLTNAALCLSNVVYIFTVGIGSAFAYTAAYFFDVAIQLSLNGTAYALTFVSTGWTTARDLANMAFLFILIFIAFQILFYADTANTQQVLAAVIVIALLVNFSFFFTRLIIDAGNLLSIEFYNSIPAGPISASTAIGSSAVPAVAGAITSSTSSFSNAKDLTAAIMNMLQLQGLFNTNSFTAFNNAQQGIGGFLVVLLTLCFLYIAAAMMMWALAVTFVSVGIKFLIRIVVLWFLIIFSPLAFVARAVPQFRGYFDRWLKELVRHAFYPVAFLFIFLILVNFTNSMSCVTAANTNTATACTGLIDGVFNSLSSPGVTNQNFILQLGIALANVGLRLGFVLAILYMGMKASESFSVMGASAANKAGDWFGGKIKSGALLPLRAASATTGWVGRNTAGKYLKEVHERPGFALKAEQKGIRGGIWQSARDVTKRLANSTYDPRNAPGLTVLKKVAEKTTGTTFNTGKAATKGYMDEAKERAEKQKKDKAERAAIIRDDLNRKALEQIDKDIKASTPAAPVIHDPKDIDRVKNMNKREIESLKADQLVNIAHLLKESQAKVVQDSDKYTDEEKDKVRKISEPVSKNQKLVVEELRKLNSKLTSGVPSPIINSVKKGATIGIADASAMRTDLDVMKNTLQTNLQAAQTRNDQGAIDDIKSDLNHVRHAITSARDLERGLDNVPAHAGRPEKQIIAD